jgi:hypothetical protein
MPLGPEVLYPVFYGGNDAEALIDLPEHDHTRIRGDLRTLKSDLFHIQAPTPPAIGSYPCAKLLIGLQIPSLCVRRLLASLTFTNHFDDIKSTDYEYHYRHSLKKIVQVLANFLINCFTSPLLADKSFVFSSVFLYTKNS